jgi:microcystin-dependent protein
MLFAGTFAPLNYAFCDGSLQAISQNETLYTLIGTTYGGDGVNTFALPDLRGRVPVHQGTGVGTGTTYVPGQLAGTESVTLSQQQIPVHNHSLIAIPANGNQGSPSNGFLSSSGVARYTTAAADVAMSNQSINVQGGSQPHDNMQPFVAISFVIALYGIFPTQN